MDRTTDEITPECCPNGHALRRDAPARGWLPCWCSRAVDGRHGHRLHRCPACDEIVQVPPHVTGPLPARRATAASTQR